MKREEIIQEFASFIAQRTMVRVEGEFYEKIFLEMSSASSRDEALDVFLSNIFSSVLVTLEQFQKIKEEELFNWGNERLPRFRKFFKAHSPKKNLKEKEAVKKVIYFILKEFVGDEVIKELGDWAREGELAAKLAIMLKFLRSLEGGGNN